MGSKERFMTVLARQEPDRVPVGYSSNGGIEERLAKHFGITNKWVGEVLGVDYRGVGTEYKGPPLHAGRPDRNVDCLWGWVTKLVDHGTGTYWDYCDFPLKDADEEAVAKWPMPDPDLFDYSRMAADCEARKEFAINIGGAGLACIMNTAGFLRGMEQMFMDLATDDPAGLLLIDRMLAIQLEMSRRQLEAAKGRVDFMWIGEDLGSMRGPLIGREMFHKHIKPRHKPFFDLAKSFGIPVMMHTCGSSSWAYDEYVEMGLSAVDTLQPEAAEMAPATLKKRFGDRLAFHGCISTAGPVAFGTVDETIEYCRKTLEIMKPGGGYCFSPTHALQDNSPTENVLAMYETVRKYGQY